MTDDTFSLISKLNGLMGEMLSEEMKKIGLSGFAPSYGKIFLSLRHQDCMTMSELSKLINKKPQTVTTLITNLEQLGYIKTEQSTTDKRTKYVSITQQGQEFLPQLDRISEKLYEKQFENVSCDEIEVFRSVLNKMIHNFYIHNK